MSVHQSVPMPVMRMQSVTTLKAATGVSVGQDSLETDTTAQVGYPQLLYYLILINYNTIVQECVY